MSERIFIGVAWPYANGPLHLGHIAGAYLPADIFARFQRARGNEVLMVSGSDQHGAPITILADKEKKSPREIADFFHQDFLRTWERLGIKFSLFTHTSTPNHTSVVHDIFTTLHRRGYIYQDTMLLPFCDHCRRFLPDRYVEGTCPHCGFLGARGDQCDQCGKPLNPTELVNPRCQLCGGAPRFQESQHFFLRLSAFRDRLLTWVKQQTHWRQNVLNFTTRFLEEGLNDRAITRDIDWGISIPLPGFDDKRIYVWFEAVIGYLSASKEWASRQGDDDAWKPFWDGSAKSYYFIGKDNIPFHTIIWPAMLMGYDGLALPSDVPANEFLTLEGRKLSTSRNWAVWVPDYLDGYDPDALRYMLSINMPETGDIDFSWSEFVRRNNDELVATYGNLAHRVITFTSRSFAGQVPQPCDLDGAARALLEETRQCFETMGSNLSRCRFRESTRLAMALAQKANRYLDDTSPWKSIKTDRQACATALWTSLSVISNLRLLLAPFLPFSSQRLHEQLGFSGSVEQMPWAFQELPPGQRLGTPAPLFVKLDQEVVDKETAKLGKPRA